MPFHLPLALLICHEKVLWWWQTNRTCSQCWDCAHSSSRAVQLRAGAGRLWAPSAAAAASVDGVYIGTQYGSRLDLQHGGWRGGGGDNLQCGAATSSEAGRWAAYVSAWQHKRVWPHVCQSTRLRSFLEATG